MKKQTLLCLTLTLLGMVLLVLTRHLSKGK